MGKQIAILEYTFMFDPAQTYTSGTDFEVDLAVFFKSKGYEAQIVDTRGGTGRRVLWISRVDRLEALARPVKEKGVQKVLKEMGKK